MFALKSGQFVHEILENELSKGLRPTSNSPRNTGFLSDATGAFGREGVLRAIEDISGDRIDTSVITDGFPYPQLFTFPNFIIVCGQTAIYEWSGLALTSKISGLSAGNIWSAEAFSDFIYLSNGKVAVYRDPNTGDYSTTTDYPTCEAICNFNGQVIVGSPT